MATKKMLSGDNKPNWPKLLTGGIAVALVAGLFLFNLGGFLPASPSERLTFAQAGSLSAIINDPLQLPYKLLAFALMHLPGNDLLYTRFASVLVTCLGVWLFYKTARRWYGLTTAFWSTALFATSTWTVQSGRFGTSYSLLLVMVLALINLAAWINSKQNEGRALVAFATVAGLSLFVSGGLWFVLATILLLYKPLLELRQTASPKQLSLAAGIFLGCFAVAAASLLRKPELLTAWIGLPSTAFPGFVAIAKQAVFSILYFVLKGPAMPEIWLAHTPLLDVASTVFLVFGVVFYSRHLTNPRTRLLAAFTLIGVVMVAIRGAVALQYLVPAVYLVAGGGMAYFLHQWKKVFPSNPVARIVSTGLVFVLLACIVSFHAQRYFVAWRYSPATVEAYYGPKPVSDTIK